MNVYETFHYHIITRKRRDGNCSYQLLSWRFLLERTMNHTKVCISCQEEFPATNEYFNKHKGGKYGLRAKCRSCYKIYNQNMYQKHQDKRLEEKRLELKLYPEKIKQRRKEQYIKHRERRLLDVKNYQIKNKEKIRKIRSEYTINRYHNDPAFRIKMTLSRRMRGLIKKNGTRTVDLIGCSIDDLKKYLESKFTDGMSWENYGRAGWHIDHVRPCASFDLTQETQQKICFHYTNLQPLWAADNIRKGDKVPDTF